jgi:nucleoside phosphorylase
VAVYLEDVDAESTVIVTALEHERRALERSACGRRARLACCGPGADAIERWASREGFPAGTTVILAGLAGALDHRVAPGTAQLVGTVVDLDDRRWTPPVEGDAIVVQTAAAVTTPQQKQDLSRRTGAALVDLESAAFAAAAETRGWRWAVVRGVSDGPDDRLPESVGDWVDERGRARLAKVCAWLVRKPLDLGCVARLARRSREAMDAVARVLDETLARGDG